ncbi:hypothetical protein Tco_0690551, partial [Tanacetum coccineum]
WRGGVVDDGSGGCRGGVASVGGGGRGDDDGGDEVAAGEVVMEMWCRGVVVTRWRRRQVAGIRSESGRKRWERRRKIFEVVCVLFL